MDVSIIVPSFNEAGTILSLLNRLLSLDSKWEIIVVDGGSQDGTHAILEKFQENPRIKIIYEERPEGKGTAIRKGIQFATKNNIIFQDADLELNPEEIPNLVSDLIKGKRIAVFGSRFLKKKKASSKGTLMANIFFTRMVNLIYFSHLTDVLTCYKAFPRDIGLDLDLQAKGFDIEIEIATKLIRNGIEIREKPVSYFPRSMEEGKKIRFRHSFLIFFAILKYRFWKKKKN